MASGTAGPADPSPGPRPAGRGGDVTAVVPLKALGRAKARLAPDLDPASRRDLAAWMFDRVLDACLGAAAISRVLVVAGDGPAAALAQRRGVDVLVERRPGLQAALDAADAATRGAPATLVVAADLPLARPADVDRLCAAGAHGRAVVVAPTVDGGTGALLRRPGAVITTAFGPGSASAHVRRAARAGVAATVEVIPNLRLDIDTAEQLRAAVARDTSLAPWASLL